jgi:hypothetical protein
VRSATARAGGSAVAAGERSGSTADDQRGKWEGVGWSGRQMMQRWRPEEERLCGELTGWRSGGADGWTTSVGGAQTAQLGGDLHGKMDGMRAAVARRKAVARRRGARRLRTVMTRSGKRCRDGRVFMSRRVAASSQPGDPARRVACQVETAL